MFKKWFLSLLVICANMSACHAAEPAPSLKILTHNVWYGFTKKPEPRHSAWLQWMAEQKADVVALQELNGYTEQKLADDAKHWGHAYSVLLKEDGFPIGMTSRFPIESVKRIREGMHHGMIRCKIQGVWFFAIHHHPSNFAHRIVEAQRLKEEIAELPETHARIVLAGDFNGFSPDDAKQYAQDTALVPFFQMLDAKDTKARNLNAGKIDYQGIQATLDQGFVDLVARKRTMDQGAFVGTFPTPLVREENHGTDRRLDYIFVTDNLVPHVESVQILRDARTETFSDHYPVTATIRLVAQEGKPTKVFESEATLLQETGAGEGPAWDPQRGLFTSGEGNINLRNLKGESSIYRQNAGSNGLMFDSLGRLIVCEPVRRRVSRINLDGTTTVLAETFDGKRFNQPNDVTQDSQGRLYFSDPRYGSREGMELLDDAGKPIEGVYRIDPNGHVTRIITHEVDRPNGLVVTADDRYLFVADNNNSQGGARKLWRFELRDDGTIDKDSQKLIYDWKTTRGPDGMKLDRQGRLYVAAGLNKPNPPHETADPPTAGIYVFSPEGEWIEFARIPRDETTNCAFGGDDLRTLFVTAGGTLWSLRIK